MPSEPSIIDPGGMGGSGSDPFADSSSTTVSSSVDTRRSSGAIRSIMGSLVSEISRATRESEKFNRVLERTGSLLRGLNRGGRGGGGTTSTTGAIGDAIDNTAQLAGGGRGGGGGGRLSGIGQGLSNFTGGTRGYLAQDLYRVAQAGVAQLDQRVNNAYSSMLANDRLSVLFQQTQGITQQQYHDRFREPLRDYRLGAGGINTLLGLQAQTGLSAQRQAPSIQGLSAASGYAYGTQDLTQMVRALANPMVNNRLTMTLGTGIYGPGGSERSLTEVFQSVVRGAGLTNQRMIQSGKQIGSLTRARLSSLGIPEDMHDLVLQYAEGNVQFQRKTGGTQGMYDPSKQSHRETMGIEANFATQKEETERLAALRDEKFYDRQKDNMAALENNTQALLRLQTSMEETFQALIGKRISYRGGMVARAARGLLGVGMIAGGAALMKTGIGAPIGVGLIATGAQTVMGTLSGGGPGGDPLEKGSTKGSFVNTGKRVPNMSGINETFKSRLAQMINDNPNISISQGFRSSAEQRQLFYSRYTKSETPTGVFWNGSHWKKSPSAPDAAPPGMSMHELGLAADLGGDIEWVQQNAHKYGLRTFANVGEPWHVQPVELPHSRREYEKMGAPWGRPLGAAAFDQNATFEERAWHSPQDRQRAMTSRGISTALVAAQSVESFGVSSPVSNRTRGNLSKGVPAASDIPAGFMFRTTPSYGGWGYYVPKDITSADLDALHLRESNRGWHVGPVTNSHGTFYGGLSMSDYNWNRAKKGLKAMGVDTSNWGPHANDTIERQKQAAEYLMEKEWAHNGWEPIVRGTVDWPGVGRLPSIRMPHVTGPSNVYSSKTGDPIGMPSRGGGSSTLVASGDTITIAPNIYIQSTGGAEADARRAAEEVARVFNQTMRIAALRRA